MNSSKYQASYGSLNFDRTRDTVSSFVMTFHAVLDRGAGSSKCSTWCTNWRTRPKLCTWLPVTSSRTLPPTRFATWNCAPRPVTWPVPWRSASTSTPLSAPLSESNLILFFFRSAQHFQESIWNYKINLFDHILISEWLNRMRSVDFMYKPEKPAITFDPLKISL